MKHVFKFLGLGAGIAVFAAFSACSSGSGTPIVNGDAGNEMGGSAGTGGSTSAGGSTAAGSIKVVDSFDNLTQMQLFKPNDFVPTDCSVNVAVHNDAGGSAQVDWSGSVDVNADSTTPGSMKVTATFTNWDQKWAVEMSGPSDAQGNPIDLTNKLVTANIRISEGVSPNQSYPYGAQIYVKTGSAYVWGASTWTNVGTVNNWVRLALDTTLPDGVPAGQTFDPKQPVQLGIQLSTGGAGEATYCSGNFGAAFGAPQVTIAYIDQVQIEPRP